MLRYGILKTRLEAIIAFFASSLLVGIKLLAYHACILARANSPVQGEVVVALSLGDNALPQFAGRQAGPGRVVPASRNPVFAFAVLAA